MKEGTAMPANGSPHLVKSGDRFTRLTVVAFSHNDSRHRRHYMVRCDCGATKTVQGTLLRTGNTKSCGCLGTETRRTLTKLPDHGGVINHIVLQYKRHARDRNIEFLLSRSNVGALIRLPCHYCGNDAGNLKRTKNCREGFRYNGIDRLDPKLPYQDGNTVPCCGPCNRAKATMTDAEFLAWVRKVFAHSIGNGGAVGLKTREPKTTQ